VVVAADGTGSAQRLHDLLLDNGLDFPVIGPGRRSARRRWQRRRRATPPWLHAPEREGGDRRRERPHRPPSRPPHRPQTQRESASTFEDLKAGNYVVHHQHGVGKYEGMVKRAIGGVERDYLLISYKGGDKLYVPSDQIDTLRQYVGGEAPKLHRLGGSDFAKTKSKVRSAVREIAQELVVLYQKRVNAEGHSFAQDTPWQHEMEEAFPYVETPDQRTAIDDIKADMELAHPMDRLLCGDVGFGKTEVAIRAAFKAIQDGKQVAVLARPRCSPRSTATPSPTASPATRSGSRCCRFLTAGQAKKVIEGVKDRRGRLRHRHPPPARADVKFKDLGLLVVDEEQRFGVQHKER
jgi:transcription-repair coupling factor (superfamily II helicase)